jgi:virginiamycin A acetyltransferase
VKSLLKSLFQGIFLAFALPSGLLCGFGRIRAAFTFFAQHAALVPGLPGDYFRVAFYRLTLDSCHPESRIQFGSYFAHPQARVSKGVYIGSYCILGQVLSGANQHPRDEQGRIQSSEKGTFSTVQIGADCWIGAQAIVMANVGSGTTVGAGAVVISELPAGVVGVGNPARIVSVGQPGSH